MIHLSCDSAALRLGLTADEFLERRLARLAMLPRGGELSFVEGGKLPGFRASPGLGLEVPEAGPGGQRPGRSWYGFAPCGWPVSGGEEDQQGAGVGVGPGSGEDAAEVLADDPDDGRDDNGKDQGGPGAGDRQEDTRRDEAEDGGEDDGHRGALARDQVRCVPVE